MDSVAVRKPTALGRNSTVKVVEDPAAMLLVVGWAMMKSAALSPLIETNGLPVKLSGAEPALVIVKVSNTPVPAMAAAPKSVLFEVVGDVSLSGIDWLFEDNWMLGLTTNIVGAEAIPLAMTVS